MFKPQPPIYHDVHRGLTDRQFIAIATPLALIAAAALMATVFGLISWDVF